MTGGLPPIARWRLILGDAAEDALGSGLSDAARSMDSALEWLYGRDESLGEREIHRSDTREGGRGDSTLSVPDWVNAVHRLFPRETIERLERDAVERFHIDEMVTHPEVLRRAQPSTSLLAAVLRTRHLLKPEVLALARALVAEVVRELMETLRTEVRQAFGGTRDRRRPGTRKVAAQLDFKRTLARNLKNWRPDERKLYLDRPRFFSRSRRMLEPWQVILLVDQSGSMVTSVIHSAVTAACLWGLPGVRTHLVAFDTSVVDLTRDVVDPVELLMNVQLGGGTDIQQAVEYAQELVDAPRRAIVVLISDFYEGTSPEWLVRRVRALVGQGTKVLGLAALDAEAEPDYDRALAARLVDAGAEVAAMTPGQLVGWLAEKMGR
ncbi:VWA domain-containing protein [Myxococcaceae bacterium JPH2]|nr:VWA domain-containing protein [Myxococcaceae bacterium JPH2]